MEVTEERVGVFGAAFDGAMRHEFPATTTREMIPFERFSLSTIRRRVN
jgi:hypothetical protein